MVTSKTFLIPPDSSTGATATSRGAAADSRTSRGPPAASDETIVVDGLRLVAELDVDD